ncbi:hypothetical protein [Bradyrhizobium macuxiense]|uniref:hypothetical protein n=1 Tax=Bradyrhizobium macuxiense TaxID=1755647 RepID=UPI001919025E|nr:hypothetical protein [Bradyrhizobium macuxiense]
MPLKINVSDDHVYSSNPRANRLPDRDDQDQNGEKQQDCRLRWSSDTSALERKLDI